MHAVLPGLLTGLSLIIAIGAQNAFVLRLGLARNHVGAAVVICILSDALLIGAGIGGLGALVHAVPQALVVMKWVGVLYLLWFAAKSFWSARAPEVLLPSDTPSHTLRKVIAFTLAFTFLNPHVYVDAALLGSIANQYGTERWWFWIGTVIASTTWFSTLGFGSRMASRLMSRPATWQILDATIGVVMLLIALRLATADLA